ncbi:MAG: DUF4831 family protein [Dysgonamonadaceae bacterium]|nr:DUF4831 family protein [Dysgonamonadaceae bacterium]MDD4729262.1 DUF4831 family protein [Dysgonamonadaceae bacterium]
MNTNIKIIAIALLLISASLTAQTPIRHNALRSNDYGVVYNLPVTQLDFELNITKTTYKRGEYYQYAKQYLSIDNPIVEDKVAYKLESVEVHNVGIPNKNESYLIQFRSNSVEPFVYLTKDGLICSINHDAPIIEQSTTSKTQIEPSASVNAQSLLTEEILLAGSSAKQAELIAKQIFALRLSRTDILTGEAENMPPDGDAYKLVMTQINLQEKALLELFSGSVTTENITAKVSIIPSIENIDREVPFRFSEKLGLVDADDLAGEPIYLSLINKNPQPQVELSDRDIRRLEKKFSEGLVYNVPSKAQLTLTYHNESLINTEVDVVQYGTQDVLTKRMFDNKKQPIKVQFYPNLGAVKQITQ